MIFREKYRLTFRLLGIIYKAKQDLPKLWQYLWILNNPELAYLLAENTRTIVRNSLVAIFLKRKYLNFLPLQFQPSASYRQLCCQVPLWLANVATSPTSIVLHSWAMQISPSRKPGLALDFMHHISILWWLKRTFQHGTHWKHARIIGYNRSRRLYRNRIGVNGHKYFSEDRNLDGYFEIPQIIGISWLIHGNCMAVLKIGLVQVFQYFLGICSIKIYEINSYKIISYVLVYTIHEFIQS